VLKVVGIIGYSNSGKTTLIRALAHELKDRGHQVAVIKHTSHDLDLQGKDTARLREVVDQVGLISPRESGVFWGQSLNLEELISYLGSEIVLVEGFKAARTFPKIVCLRDEPGDPEQEWTSDLFDGLTLCAVGPAERPERVDVPVLGLQDIWRIADLVVQKGFKLPNLNCGACGYERCYDLAREIVAGARTIDDCVSIRPDTQVTIDGQPMPMNPFISALVRNTLLGMLSSLRGFKNGKVELATRC